MNILIATGRLAQQTVRDAVKGNADVLVLDIEIAAFITPGMLRSALPDDRYDLILVPGLVSSDFTDLEERCGTEIRLGPRHAYDLTSVLSCVGELELSKTIPACEFLSTKMREDARSHLKEHESDATPALEICGRKIGGDSSMKVMAEIAGATAMPEGSLAEKIREFDGKGADIIDLGATMDCNVDDVVRSVKIAKATTELPVSIDTLDPDLIVAGIESGVDLVLSLNSSNIDATAGAVLEHGTAVVIIPDQGDPVSLFRNIEYAKEIGIEKIIADPVLDPVGHAMSPN